MMHTKQKLAIVALTVTTLAIIYTLRDQDPVSGESTASKIVKSVASGVGYSFVADAASPFGMAGVSGVAKVQNDMASTLPQFDPKEIDKTHMPMPANAMENAEKTARFVGYMNAINPLLIDRSTPISAETYQSLSNLSEKLLIDKYLTLAEYEAITLRLLESQYSGAVLEQKQLELRAKVAAANHKLMTEGLPMNNPIFRAYKQAEEQILQEANAMKTFPNGMSKEDYVVGRISQLKKEF